MSIPESSAADKYRASLSHAPTTQEQAAAWPLWEAKLPELAPAFEIPKEDLEALQAAPGILRGVRWRRFGTGEFRSWLTLEKALAWRDEHRGYRWEERHARVLRDVEAQCWGRAEVEACGFHVQWLADAFVCPLSGECIRLPRLSATVRLLAIVVLAFQSGAGGVLMSLDQWGAVLGCSSRSVWNHRARLGGLVNVRQLWVPTPNGQGSQRGHLLMRLGSPLATLAAIERLARAPRRRAAPVSRGLARSVTAELHRRARRRRYDVAGASWRGKRNQAESTRDFDWRTRRSRALKRQDLPHSPPLTGLRDLPPVGGPKGYAPGPHDDVLAPLASSCRGAGSLPRQASTPTIPSPEEPLRDAFALEGESFSEAPVAERPASVLEALAGCEKPAPETEAFAAGLWKALQEP